jgi:hypothetical protein
MPDTHEQIDEWFCTTLSDRAMCMVRATAIFHGAPANNINSARQEIYKYLYPKRDEQLVEQERASEILKNVFVDVRENYGVRRIYWQDAGESGYSLFGLKVLRLLAGEIEGTAGIQGHNILPILEKWASSTGDGEHAWRAAYALGVIWWILDQERLRRTVFRWAHSSDPQTRRATAWMIYGAYEIEHSEKDVVHVTLATRTPMMEELLRQWSADVLEPNSSAEFAGVVIMAYGLIGCDWPDVGLDGLDYLLGLTPTSTTVSVQAMPVAAFIPAALIYVELARIGHTREVIARLAKHAGGLGGVSKRGILDKEARHEQAWRNFGLKRLFFIFFLLVASSLEGDPKQQHTNSKAPDTAPDTATDAGTTRYGAESPLPSSLPIPLGENLDTLLAGILAPSEESLHGELATLLLVALYHWNPDQVSQTLQAWAETIWRQQYADASHLRLRFLNFLGALGKRAQELDKELGIKEPQSSYAKFVRLLQQWPRKSTTYAFAENALSRLAHQRAAQQVQREDL